MRMEICDLLSMVAAAGWFNSVASLTPDGETLLEMKIHLNDTQQVLSDWRSWNSTPCNWVGIDCDPRDVRVTSIEYSEANPILNWNARLRIIALGSARGLAYLHHDCSPAIVHGDIKASNVMLEENLEPHVSDFGPAKLLVDNETQVTTAVAGTFGYLAPEYLRSGRATEKYDVFRFAVLLFELVSGKRPTDQKFVSIRLKYCWLVKCTEASPDDRPSMNVLLHMLEEGIMTPCPSEFYESHSEC